MARIARTLETLLAQVGAGEDSIVGGLDTFGVYRTAMVPARLAGPVAGDERVREVVVVPTDLGDVALVSVKSGRLGDLRYPFTLE